MSLDPLQNRIIGLLKHRRSQNSFVGGSSVFNKDFPRMSDALDIYDEDVSIQLIADADIGILKSSGLRIASRFDHYGLAIEAIVTDETSKTMIEWSEADRERFFPVQPDDTFGWTLHKSDLAIQKLIASATRHKARDGFDLTLIDKNYMPLAVAALAAPAKLKGVSPAHILERARTIAMGIPSGDYDLIRREGTERQKTAGEIKLDLADRIEFAIGQLAHLHPDAMTGMLYLDKKSGHPVFPDLFAPQDLNVHSASPRGAIPRLQQPD